jgi:lipopolysaccharide export LptBFGC system permease protein LptF
MRLIDKYIFINLLKNFLLTTFVFLFLGLLTRIFHYSSLITENNGSMIDLLQILVLIQPKMLSILTPFTFFIASFLTYNSLVHANEHVAVYNCGLNEFGLVKPFFYLAGILFCLNIFLSAIIVPASYNRMNVIHNEIAQKLSSSILKPKEFISQKNVLIFIDDVTNDKIAKGIVIIDERNPNSKTVVVADEGKIGFDGNKILFDAGQTYVSRKTDFSNFPLISNFEQYKISFFISNLFDDKGSEASVISSSELVKRLLKGEKYFIKEFKVRFGWAFFTILIPFAIVVSILKFFNFTRSKTKLSHILATILIFIYIVSSGVLGESMLNSSIRDLFFYYLNICLIFGFLLFKLKLKNFG